MGEPVDDDELLKLRTGVDAGDIDMMWAPSILGLLARLDDSEARTAEAIADYLEVEINPDGFDSAGELVKFVVDELRSGAWKAKP